MTPIAGQGTFTGTALYNKAVEFTATGCYISILPGKITGFKKFTGAGFMGTVLAVLLTPFLPERPLFYGLFILIFTAFSILIAERAAALYGTHDDPRIVIDEIIGYWFAIAFLERSIFSLTSAFILFRILDTLKPWPIKKFERELAGGFGIVFDDLLAGFGANLLTRFLLIICAHLDFHPF